MSQWRHGIRAVTSVAAGFASRTTQDLAAADVRAAAATAPVRYLREPHPGQKAAPSGTTAEQEVHRSDCASR